MVSIFKTTPHGLNDDFNDQTKEYSTEAEWWVKEEEYGHVDDYSKPHGFHKVIVLVK